MHVEGGKSEIENIIVLCDKCHDKMHGSEKVELPSEKEIEEVE